MGRNDLLAIMASCTFGPDDKRQLDLPFVFGKLVLRCSQSAKSGMAISTPNWCPDRSTDQQPFPALAPRILVGPVPGYRLVPVV